MKFNSNPKLSMGFPLPHLIVAVVAWMIALFFLLFISANQTGFGTVCCLPAFLMVFALIYTLISIVTLGSYILKRPCYEIEDKKLTVITGTWSRKTFDLKEFKNVRTMSMTDAVKQFYFNHEKAGKTLNLTSMYNHIYMRPWAGLKLSFYRFLGLEKIPLGIFDALVKKKLGVDIIVLEFKDNSGYDRAILSPDNAEKMLKLLKSGIGK